VFRPKILNSSHWWSRKLKKIESPVADQKMCRIRYLDEKTISTTSGSTFVKCEEPSYSPVKVVEETRKEPNFNQGPLNGSLFFNPYSYPVNLPTPTNYNQLGFQNFSFNNLWVPQIMNFPRPSVAEMQLAFLDRFNLFNRMSC